MTLDRFRQSLFAAYSLSTAHYGVSAVSAFIRTKVALRTFIMLLFTTALAACNGSSGQNTSTPTTPDSGVITLSTQDAQGNNATNFEATDTITVSILVRDSFNNPANNANVAITSTLGALSQASVLTGTDGRASISITTTATDVGVGTITATSTVETNELTASTNIQVTPIVTPPTPIMALSLLDKDCVSAINSQFAGETFCLSALYTQDGQPVANQVVSFSAGTGTLRQTTALTNAEGRAVTYIDSVAADIGASSATASVDEVSASVNYEFRQNIVVITPILSLDLLNEACTGVINSQLSGETFCLSATYTQNGAPLAGEVITFNAGIGALRQTTVLTNAAGQAVTYIDSATTDFGASAATATVGEANASQNYEFRRNTAATDLLSVSIFEETCTTETHTLLAGNSFCARASLTRNNVPLVNQLITFDAPVGTLRQTQVLTDAQGFAQTYIDSAADTASASTLTATFGTQTATTNYQFTPPVQNQDSLTVSLLDATCTSSVTQVNINASLCVQARLLKNNTPQANEIISFATTVGTPTPANALTNSDGVAQITINSTQIGAATISANFNSNELTGSSNVEFINTQSGLPSLALSVLDLDCNNASTSTLSGTSICLSATLNDTSNQPAAGEIITFQATLGTLRQTTALTNANGVATVILDSADTDLGATQATATFNTVQATANYEFTRGQQPIDPLPVLAIKMLNGNVETNRFKSNETGQVQVEVSDANGNKLNNVIVNFTADVGTLTTSTALTNNDGIAQVLITATDTTIGAGSATASVTSGSNTVTTQINYEVLAADAVEEEVKLGYFDGTNFIEGTIGISSGVQLSNNNVQLSAGGTFGLEVVAVDQNNNRITSPLQVSFTSTCVANTAANIDAQVTTINGSAKSTYQDLSCATAQGNQDTIVASITVNNATITATRNVDLQAEALGSIEFVSVTPNTIVLKGAGGSSPETAAVTFRVRSALNNPLAQQSVSLSLDTSVGGLSVFPQEALTNSEGLVTAYVSSGTVPTSVRVTAKVAISETEAISTQSDQLTVSTGIPDQNSITIASTLLNPEAHSYTGVTAQITTYLSDAFNNPVPDGTTVSFTTEGGTITPSCTTTNGTCNVTWTGTEPRVTDHRITILATAIGHETFFDTNGNNMYDDVDGSAIIDANVSSGRGRAPYQSSGFIDMAEAWRDDNENNIRDAGESFLDYDDDQNYDSENGVFNGPQCSTAECATLANENDANTKIHVRKALVMIMSGSSAKMTLMHLGDVNSANTNIDHITHRVIATNDSRIVDEGSVGNTANVDITIANEASQSFRLAISDNAERLNDGSTIAFGQTLPSGTSVNVTSTAGSITGTSSFIVPNTIGTSDVSATFGGQYVDFTLTNDNASTEDLLGTLTITIVFPSSNRTQTLSLVVSMPAAP